MTDTRDHVTLLLDHALQTLRKGSPGNLDQAMRFVAPVLETELPPGAINTLMEHLRTCGPNDRALHALTVAIQSWDHQSGKWADALKPHTVERRARILELLGFSDVHQHIVNGRILLFSEADLPVVIAEEHQPWYLERKRHITDFYWSHYTAQLLPPKGKWDVSAVGVLDISIEDVISRLSDPSRDQIYPVKGLVMGYVQSGKTSHFSGLISRAVDAGYRLVIVLAGTLDILREQTQRRIDKELVGKELLGHAEYGSDSDWPSFVSHGGRPSDLGAFDLERLTNRDEDYTELRRHLGALEFVSVTRALPFNHPDNLRSAPAKIAIIKKVPARLNKLCDDLETLRELRHTLQHVPTLVIDDESDQASINTINRGKPGFEGKRTETNQAITRLLSLLPRAQYVGYTATPFANVFIDPTDAEDLFPKDFIVSLPRPAGYMGVSDFFDFGAHFDDGDYAGNQNAFVRSVEGDNSCADNLPKAIDSFVLGGAIKLFRESKNPEKYSFRHHTMLVHHASTRTVHEADRELVDRIFGHGSRYQHPEGRDALRNLFDSDFVPVSRTRAVGEPFPVSFNELRPFVAQCLSKICAGKPVRVVNGEGKNKDDTPNFDQDSVWAILVGGTKLSRGYTVEGLTVSYYRRPAGAADTLMQMGRWFGFRQGYQDLVRLFIGRKEKKGRKTIDLYEAFGAVCLDEESLRADLKKYSRGGLKPRQVPPLVRQHLDELPPTSSNKMFNAQISFRDFAGEWTEKTSAPTSEQDISSNRDAATTLLRATDFDEVEELRFVNDKGAKRRFDAFVGSASGADIHGFLQDYKWARGRDSVSLELNYIKRRIDAGALDEWYVVLPQIRTESTLVTGIEALGNVSVTSRARVSESRFGVYSEPRHREAAAAFAGLGGVSGENEAVRSRTATRARAVLVLYFVREDGEPQSPVSIGFGIQYPGQKAEKALLWSVRDPANEDAVVVAA